MGVNADQFAADLNDLRIIGAIDLPTLEYAYAVVNNAVAGTAGADSDAFRTEPGGPPSLIAEVWRDLRDELQNVLGLTAENLHNAGQIVLHIVQAYADTDDSARAALLDAWQDGTPPGTADRERILPDQPPAVRLAPA
jgi:hypothetical protein